MRAAIYDHYGGPEQIRLTELPDPIPRRGEVLLAVRACGVNLSDHEFLTGSPAYARFGGLLRPRQPILGSDIVGEVLTLGPGISHLQPGQRVMADAVTHRGGFAQRVALPAALCAPVPDGLTDDIAAALPQPGAIALQGMAGVQAGMRVLVNGAGGGSGTLALQLAKAAGAHVTVVDTAAKIAWLATLGADACIDHLAQDFTALGENWDLILDMVATRPAGEIAGALAPGGIYRAVGGRVRVILPLAVRGLLQRSKTIGVLAVRTGAVVTRQVADRAVAGDLRPVIAGVLPLSGVAEALAKVGAGLVHGKLVIRP